MEAIGTVRCVSGERNWWAVIFDDDLANLYKHWLQGNWDLPRSGVHISLIRGEYEEKRAHNPERFEGAEVLVRFDPVISTNRESFWINCESETLDMIREECGLGTYYRDTYHITLGNFKNKNRRVSDEPQRRTASTVRTHRQRDA